MKIPSYKSNVAPATPARVQPMSTVDQRIFATLTPTASSAVGFSPSRADLHPVGRVLEHEPQHGDEQEREVGEQRLLEEHRPEGGNPVEERDAERARLGDRQRRADELQEEEVTESEPEQIDTDAADALFGFERDADEGGDDPHHHSDPRTDEDPERRGCLS